MKKIDLHIHTETSTQDEAFEFCQKKLDEYVSVAKLDCIATVNHNRFSRSLFESIRSATSIPVFPGIEVDLETGQILVISDGCLLDDFDAKCALVSKNYKDTSKAISLNDFVGVFGDLNNYILIPHYKKSPALSDHILRKLRPYVTAGEVGSPKKFVHCIKNPDSLVPLYFSDCRIRKELSPIPTRQTYIDCGDVTFSALKECIRDKNKVSLSEKNGNRLFQVFDNGQMISTGLNVVLGDRSSGKSHMLTSIAKNFENTKHIKQFSLVSQTEEDDAKEFSAYLSRNQGTFSKNFLDHLQRVIEDVLDIEIDADEQEIENYLATLSEFANETLMHDSFSKAKIYSGSTFTIEEQDGLKELISSTKNLVSNVEYKETINKYVSREKLEKLYVELMQIYIAQDEKRRKKKWVNELVTHIKDQLQIKSTAPRVAEVELYRIAMNKRKVQKFEKVAKLAKTPCVPLRVQKRGFEIVAQVGPFCGAGEVNAVIKRQLSFSAAMKQYSSPYQYLQELKKLGSPFTTADLSRCFVKIDYRILNKDGVDASGGQRAEFRLLDEIGAAEKYDMLLIDEPESSFDNHFLKDDVNEIIKEMSKKMPVILVTHNNTVGLSIKPDYLLHTCKATAGGAVQWSVFSGYPTSKTLETTDGRCIATREVLMGSLEAGTEAYNERKMTYENLED